MRCRAQPPQSSRCRTPGTPPPATTLEQPPVTLDDLQRAATLLNIDPGVVNQAGLLLVNTLAANAAPPNGPVDDSQAFKGLLWFFPVDPNNPGGGFHRGQDLLQRLAPFLDNPNLHPNTLAALVVLHQHLMQSQNDPAGDVTLGLTQQQVIDLLNDIEKTFARNAVTVVSRMNPATLPPPSANVAAQTATLIAQLGDPAFTKREDAEKALLALAGGVGNNDLMHIINRLGIAARGPDPEIARRAEKLLVKFGNEYGGRFAFNLYLSSWVLGVRNGTVPISD